MVLLVYKSHNYGLWMFMVLITSYNYISWGLQVPTVQLITSTGAPHCMWEIWICFCFMDVATLLMHRGHRFFWICAIWPSGSNIAIIHDYPVVRRELYKEPWISILLKDIPYFRGSRKRSLESRSCRSQILPFSASDSRPMSARQFKGVDDKAGWRPWCDRDGMGDVDVFFFVFSWVLRITRRFHGFFHGF